MADDLISSAVTFLQDPKVADAPLAKRIAFLESKGLSSEQVQVALQRAQSEASSSVQDGPSRSQGAADASYAPSRPPTTYAPYAVQQAAPPLPQRDWRDWFIMAVVSGGFSWALYFLAKHYVIPLVSPPTQSQLDTDKETVAAQFDQVQEMLSILQKDTEEVKTKATEQNEKVEAALSEVNTAVTDMKQKTERRENDIRRLALEMDQLRELIPNAIESVKTVQNDALNDLGGELRSLKTLLQNRLKAPGSSSSPVSNIAGSSQKSASSTTVGSSGSASQAPQGAQQSASVASKPLSGSDPLAKFTSRGGNGIPEWQKSAMASSALTDAPSETDGAAAAAAGSSAATANNVQSSEISP